MPPTATATDEPSLHPDLDHESGDRPQGIVTLITIPVSDVATRTAWADDELAEAADEAIAELRELDRDGSDGSEAALPVVARGLVAEGAGDFAGSGDTEGRVKAKPVTRANLRASTSDGAAFGAMVGLGESYLSAFALAVGLGEISAGLVSSVPLLVGGILQLISLRAVHWFGGEKRWIVFCAAMQGLSFVPLVIAALVGSISLLPLILIASVYWTGGLAAGPPWNTWMETIVPSRIRARYFSCRTRMTQLCTLLGLVGGGAVLQFARNQGEVLLGFATIFAAAAIFRMWSVTWLIRHRQPSHDMTRGNEQRIRVAKSVTATEPQAVTAAKGSGEVVGIEGAPMSGLRLLSYLVAVQAAVQISGPYFSPYMLKQLELSYSEFVTLLAVGFVSKIISLSWWGKQTHQGGAKRLLWIGGVGIVPVAGLWIFSNNLYYLASVQMLSGFLWAAYELGFFLMFFETLPIEKRTRMLTYYNLANMVALCVGAFTGAVILRGLGGDQSAYWVLFGTSSVCRFLALGLLFGAGLKAIPVIQVCMRVLGVRVATSSFDSPILSTFDNRSKD